MWWYFWGAGQDDANQAIALEPKNAIAYEARATVHRTRGEREQALSDFSQAIMLNPRYAEAYYNRGLLYKERGDRAAAIADLQRARALFQHPQDVQKAEEQLHVLGVDTYSYHPAHPYYHYHTGHLPTPHGICLC